MLTGKLTKKHDLKLLNFQVSALLTNFAQLCGMSEERGTNFQVLEVVLMCGTSLSL